LSLIHSLPKTIIVYLIATIPIIERGAIPIGIGVLKLSPLKAFISGVAGNLTPVVPLLLLLEPVTNWLTSKIKLVDKLVQWLFSHTRRRHSQQLNAYGVLGVLLVTAIPAPGLGPWTGCLIAFIFDVKFLPAFLAIVVGVLIAGFLLVIGSLGFVALSSLIASPLITGIILGLVVIIGFYIGFIR
jgi:uncharacterized membrane protein